MATRGNLKSVEFKQAALAPASSSVSSRITSPDAPGSQLRSGDEARERRQVPCPSATVKGTTSTSAASPVAAVAAKGAPATAKVHCRRNNSAPRPRLRRVFQRNGRPDETSARIPLSPDRRPPPKNRRHQRHRARRLGPPQYEQRRRRTPRRRSLTHRRIINERPSALVSTRIGILRAEVTTMPGLTPETATGALHMALMSIKKEHPTTKAVLAAIPANGGDYKPEPAARTALEIAWHIVASEHRFFGSVTKGFFDVTPNPKPDSLKTGADIAKYYDDLLPQVHAALAGLTGEHLGQRNGLSRHVPNARRRIPRSRPSPFHPSPRPTLGLPPPCRRQSPRHLRRKLRLQK